jgi:nucleotide-binding universal stress UspA family protein
MKKILVPIEETQRSLKAVAYVKKHYTPEEAEIVLMMIDERLGYSVRTEVETAAIKELEEKLDLIAESFEGYKLTKMSAVGKAGVRITRAVRETGSDLIVMTKSSKDDMLNSIGSTAEYVINNAPCDVIIVSEQVNSRNEYRGLVYRTAKGTVNLRGQLGDKQSECLLPSVNQDCIYHINVTVGKIRFFHTAYNPDTRNWDLPPIPGQDVTLDIAAGETRDILVKADSTEGKSDRIRIVNRDMRKEAVFDFRITAAPANHEPKKAADEKKTAFENRATLEVPRSGIPKNFEAPEVPTFIAEARAEFDALEKEVADAAAAAADAVSEGSSH